MIWWFITPILKSLVVPVIWLALIDAIYSWVAAFFALKRIFFPANEEATLKQTNQISRLVYSNRSNCRKKFATFVSKTLTFSPQKMDEFSDRLSIASIKYLNWPSSLFGQFHNGCNKVVIEPRVVQFWSEIILVISNRTHAARSFDFEITRMISAQIALHSVQLQLLITKRSNC